MAIGRISGFSMPSYPVYVPTTDTDWMAIHTGHTEIAPDECYVETDTMEWTGVHTSYDAVFISTEAEEDEPIPDFQTMWTAVYASEPRPLYDSVISATDVSASGTLTFTMQRQEDGPPPTDVRVSVRGTDLSTWQKFPSKDSLTIDMAVPGMPPGTHTVEVEVYAAGRLVGTTQFTVTVAGTPETAAPAPPERTPPETHTSPDEAAAPEAPAQASWAPAPVVAPHTGPFAPTPTVEAPAPFRFDTMPASAPASNVPRVAGPPPQTPHHYPVGPGVYVGGQAMASGLGARATPDASSAPEAESGIIPVGEASVMDGQGGGRRPPWQQPEDSDDN